VSLNGLALMVISTTTIATTTLFNDLFSRKTCIIQYQKGKTSPDLNAKMILTAPPPNNWKRPPGRPRITWLNTVQRHLRAYNLTLN